jgi:hypothetical protein
MSPTISTKKSKETKRAVKSRMGMEREKVILLAVAIACGASIIIHLAIQIVSAMSAGRVLDNELNAQKAQRVLVVQEDEEKFQQELEIAKKARGENLAAQHREEEYEKRLALDPALAQSDREKAMLKMKAIGEDPEIPDKEAVEKIVKLACPPKSGFLVTEQKNGGFMVQVAFPYKWVVDSHPEMAKYLPGYYYEVQKTAAGIMKDVFQFGGARNIASLTVACQNIVSVKTSEGVKKELRDLFIVSGSPGTADWARVSRPEVENVWSKKRDQFPTMLKGY